MFSRLKVCCFLLSSVAVSPVNADEVLLDDGSRLKGTVKQIANDTLVMDTAFAGEVEITLNKINRLSTDEKRFVQLDSGDRIAGQLVINEEGQQQIAGTSFGTVDIDTARINGLWDTDEKRPIMGQLEQEHQQEVAELKENQEQKVQQLKSDYETEVQKLRERRDELEDPWSGSLAFGLQGARGNTQRFGIQGRADVYRETDFDRLALYLESNYQSEDSSKTVDEQLAGALLEHDITKRLFAYGQTDFEIDEFENLDLRALATTGLGYFFIRQPDLKFKGRAGIGYQFESFSDGTTNKEPTGQLGYDVDYTYNSWINVFHNLTYYPAFTDPAEDYRIVTNLGGELPLTEGKAWKLRANVRNQYDNQPAAGVENTDTTYQLNLVYDWK